MLRCTTHLLLAIGLVSLSLPAAFARTLVVNGAHQSASDQNPGTEASPMRTIQRAAELAQPGDLVLVHGGEYRERVAPARGGTPEMPIVYRAAPNETVLIKGSERWRPTWTRVSDQRRIYSGVLSAALFSDAIQHPFRTRLKGMPPDRRFTLGQVFVDGHPLREVDNGEKLANTPATWHVDESGDVLTIHFPHPTRSPDQCVVEVTTRDRVFAPHRRGLGYIQVRGFTMEHCANQFPDQFWQSDSPQAGALGCRAGHHWVIQDNTIRFAKSIGVDCGYEGRRDLEGTQSTPQNTGYHRIENNRIADNGCCGIAGMRSFGTEIIGNVIERNNSNHHTFPEIGGIKLHYFVDGLIAGNLIRDNDAYGIWLDNVYRNARVQQNVIIGNRGSAVFVELGEGPLLIDNNVLASTRFDFNPQDPRADGLYTHDASGVTFVHNLVFGCERFGASSRKKTNRARAGASRIDLRNNLFIDNRAGHLNVPFPGPDAIGNRVENNLFDSAGEFLLNPWGGMPQDQLIRRISIETGTRPQLWNETCPRLSLVAWQKVFSGASENQEIEIAAPSVSPDLVLTLQVGNDLIERRVSPVEQVQDDFFGRTISATGAFVGPFQQMHEGTNRVRLWPASKQAISDPLQLE